MPVTAPPPVSERGPVRRFVDDFRQEFAHELSDWRADSGPGMSRKLVDIPPEERTLLDAFESIVKSSTDYFDGRLTDGLPYSEKGRDKDRDADVKYVMEQYRQLTANGEIPEIHYRMQIRRERAMRMVRWAGEALGMDLRSLQVNRFKTADNMAMLATAHSPLATKSDLLRFEASLGTGASYTGLTETIFQYLSDVGDLNAGSSEKDTSDPRNSKARKASVGPAGFVAGLLDEHLPGVTPTHVTRTGELAVEASSALLVVKPEWKFLATTVFTGGSLLDIIDGALARLKGLAGKDGMVQDVQADLRQQLAALSALSITAMRHGNKVAAANYAIAAAAMPLSALTRAQAESHGLIVAEGGLGTRAGRGILSGMGMAFNDDRDLSDVISATLAVSTANTVYERQDVIRRGKDSKYCVGTTDSAKLIEEAKVRRQAILPYAIAGMIIGTSLAVANQTGVVEDRFGLEDPLRTS